MFDTPPHATMQGTPPSQPVDSREKIMSRTNVLSTATPDYLELMGNGKAYRVPPYQRDYAWTEEEEWEDLWSDVLGLREQPDARHYMAQRAVQVWRSDLD